MENEANNNAIKEWEKRLQTVLLSLITAAVLGMFGFLWTMNRDFGIMQERDRVRSQNEIEWKNDLKEMKIDVMELKGNFIKLNSRVDEMQSQNQERH